MPLSLDDILTNPELESSVSIDWVKDELSRQPYNQYLQSLLSRKTSEHGYNDGNSTQSLVDSILADEKMNMGGSYFIRDVELDFDSTFAQAGEEEIKDIKEDQITDAAIGAGAIITGSILTGANTAAAQPNPSKRDPISNTEQIEESGLLGFLNRIDGTVKRSEPNASVDPMHNKDNYQKEEIKLELKEELKEEEDQEIEMAHQPTLETKEGDEAKIDGEDESENYPDVMDFNNEVAKKKKKVKGKAKKPYRWSSMTASDYKIKTLDPFTEWINTIDGVEISTPEVNKKSKKSKKKKKKARYLESLQGKPEIASEQLADLLVNQGHMDQAIDMYKRLSLKYPEKSSFFAGKIDTINKN